MRQGEEKLKEMQEKETSEKDVARNVVCDWPDDDDDEQTLHDSHSCE